MPQLVMADLKRWMKKKKKKKKMKMDEGN